MIINCGIYEIRERSTGLVYIGSSCNIRKRWKEHVRQLDAGKHHSPQLQRAWRKRGATDFTFRNLIACSADQLLFYEQRFLDALRPHYNCAVTAGSRRGMKATPELREKLSVAHMGKASSRKGVTLSEETRKKISANRAGKGGGPRTPERLKKAADAMRATKSCLTAELVRKGRRLKAEGANARTVSEAVGCSIWAAYDFLSGKTFSWVE